MVYLSTLPTLSDMGGPTGAGRTRSARGRTAEARHLDPHRWLQSSPSGLVALALAIGAGAGFGAVAFRYLILGFTLAFTGHRDYSSDGHAPYGFFHGLGFWFVVAAPVIGGLVYGPLIQRYAREARGHGVPEVMYAVSERGGRIRPPVAVVKSLASAVCIGSGGSVGREGPIVQIGSALGSTLGQWTRMPESRLRILVACGAAGGISATFNAPIAGVFFALELILRDFEAEAFGVVVLSSFVADIIGRAAFGSHPFLTLPPFELTRHSNIRCTPASASSVRWWGSHSSMFSTARRTSPTASGTDPNGSAPQRVVSCSGCFCWRCRRCTASAIRDSKAQSADAMSIASSPAAGRKDDRDQPDDRDRRLGWRVRALAVHGRDARHRLRHSNPRSRPGLPPRRPAPTG